MMKLTVTLELPGRTQCEQVVVGDTRQSFRDAMSTAAVRMELATFGPPGPVEEMTREDPPVHFAPLRPDNA
jgi:hypothetical protein